MQVPIAMRNVCELLDSVYFTLLYCIILAISKVSVKHNEQCVQ